MVMENTFLKTVLIMKESIIKIKSKSLKLFRHGSGRKSDQYGVEVYGKWYYEKMQEVTGNKHLPLTKTKSPTVK